MRRKYRLCVLTAEQILERRTEVEEILASKSEWSGECLLWTAGVGSHGYGDLYLPKYLHQTTHVITWILAHGPIPAGKCVLHSCDVHRCRNIAHLFLGTKRNNTHDMMRKGRHRAVRLASGRSGVPYIHWNKRRRGWKFYKNDSTYQGIGYIESPTFSTVAEAQHWAKERGHCVV